MARNQEIYDVNMPEPRGSEKVTKQDKERRTPAERMRDAYYDALEVDTFRRTAGLIDKNDKPSGIPSDAMQVVLATVNAQSQALNSLLTKIVELQVAGGKTGEGDRNEFMKYLVGEVKEMKTRIESGAPDPLAIIEETSKRIDSLTDTMRKRMGIPEIGATSGVEGMKFMLDIEKMKQEAQDRQNQFEMAMKTMERQWKKEDKKWEAEFTLKTEEIRKQHDTREKAIGALQDLTASVIESIEAEPEAPRSGKPPMERSAKKKAEPEQPNIPVSFTCENCGEMVHVPPGSLEAKCTNCESEYDLRASE